MQNYIDTASSLELNAYIKHLTAEVERQAALSQAAIDQLCLTPTERAAVSDRLRALITAAHQRLAAMS